MEKTYEKSGVFSRPLPLPESPIHEKQRDMLALKLYIFISAYTAAMGSTTYYLLLLVVLVLVLSILVLLVLLPLLPLQGLLLLHLNLCSPKQGRSVCTLFLTRKNSNFIIKEG